MTKATVYGNAQSFRTQKVLIAAKYAEKQVDVKDHLPHDKFPLGLTPAFEEGQTNLFGADAIAKHLAASNSTYVPKDPSVDQWLLWSEAELLPNVLAYVLPSLSFAHVDTAAVEQARQELHSQLQHFDKLLLTRTYLVGERLSVADVSVALNLLAAFQNVFDSKVRNSLVNVTRWFTTVVNQKHVKEVVGEVKLAESVSTFNADGFKKNSASAPKKDDKKHHDKHHDNKKHGKKDGEKKEAEKPAAKPAKAQEEPEDDTPVAPKFVDPLSAFPAGKFSFDGFKRVYSNEDTLTKAIPYFWEHFEPENYSIWYCEYKYPEELTQVFMTCNLVAGMFQRLDKLNKNAFGSMCVFGENNDSTISGLWVWRGQKLAFELSPDWQVDYESYSWTKLDPADEKTKATVKAYFAWEGFENPKKFNQGKIFK
jgi:elongation factor 1-gamma